MAQSKHLRDCATHRFGEPLCIIEAKGNEIAGAMAALRDDKRKVAQA
ncbi:MAG: hypothetical protein V1809_00185 [Planctomycetota bacterium]